MRVSSHKGFFSFRPKMLILARQGPLDGKERDLRAVSIFIDCDRADARDRQRRCVFQPGPLFANLVLTDEINRASPKTQSALLEAMQERRVRRVFPMRHESVGS